MVVEAGVGDILASEILGQVGTRFVNITSSRRFEEHALEFLLFVNDLHPMFEVGSAILTGGREMAVDSHLVGSGC